MSTEAEQIDFTKVKIKQERPSPPPQKPVEDLADEVIPKLFNPSPVKPSAEDVEEPDEKKPVEPVKSSNEILAELFRVFNATPPESLLNDEILLEKKKKKHKDKKHKKKSKKRHRDSSQENNSNDDKSKVKKRKKHKRHKAKDEKDNKVKQEPSSPISEEARKSRDGKSPNKDTKTSDMSDFSISSEDESNVKVPKDPIVIKREKETSPKPIERKIVIKNLKNSKVLEEADRKRKIERKSTRKEHEEVSDISLSDEETFTREQQSRRSRQPYDNRRRDERRNNFSRNSYRRSRSRDRDKNRWNSGRSRSRSRSRFWGRSRSRSRNRRSDDLHIDKKKLLEIARKNAISMFKNGSLPGTQSLPQELKNKVLMKMRYGGKSVEELTEFCKKLSNGESLNDLSSLSSNEDSDYDKHGNDKAFHHPFVLKDRGPIVMNIKNATAIPPKTAEQAKAILTQFPVSSGQHHRLHESEWVPVPVTKPAKVEVPPVAAAVKRTKPIRNLIPLIRCITAALPKNVFAKPLPAETQQPAFVPTNPLPTVASSTEQIALPPETLPPPLPVPPVTVPALTTNNTATTTNSNLNIFQSMDVSPIITARLHAMRKLQKNPCDPEALQTMEKAHQGIKKWAHSYEPGKFTGSTGANILTPQELSAGQQAWVKRDQLLTTTPVSGGMGMHLLQKMGWKPGEGLGKTKNGCLQPLLLEVKMDKRGLVHREEPRIPPLLPPGLLVKPRPPPPPPFISKKRQPHAKSVQAAEISIENKHPVSLLGEICGKRKWGPPAYDVVNEEGPSHQKNFIFNVVVNGMMYQPSIPSKSKKEAKALAAKYCLQQLGVLKTT